MLLGFPLDYMHLVCLGVMKRLLMLWRGAKRNVGSSKRRPRKTKKTNKAAKDRVHRLSDDDIETINTRIEEGRKMFPMEFQRKGQSLNDLEDWKAVEFRHFLLYSGPVILKDVLEPRKYDNFLIFHATIRILSSPSLKPQEINFAEKWLRYFVDQFGVIYGEHQLVYNVHSLMHLANDCRFQGPLDAFSAFPFESYLGQLKSLLRGTRRPLAQLKRRLSEIDHCDLYSTSSKQWCGFYEFKIYTLNAKSFSDSFLMYERCQIMHITSISELYVTGTPYPITNANGYHTFYSEPIASDRLQIYMTEMDDANEVTDSVTLPLSDVTKLVKCVRMITGNYYVFFPLLHNL